MIYVVIIARNAKKALDFLPNYIRSKVTKIILSLENQPRPTGCKKLIATSEYRIRVGDYRIVYEVLDNEQLVKIHAIKHRKEAYK